MNALYELRNVMILQQACIYEPKASKLEKERISAFGLKSSSIR